MLVLGDYYLAHLSEAVSVDRMDFAGELPAKDWAVNGTTSGSGQARLVSPVFDRKNYDPAHTSYGTKLESMASLLAEMEAGIEPLAESYATDEAELLVVAYGTAGRYLSYVIRELRKDALPIGIIRPVTLWPFPAKVIAQAARTARAVAVYELNAGQMIDDVRLSVLGEAPVFPIGGPSYDGDGFGIAPDLNTNVLAERLRGALERARSL